MKHIVLMSAVLLMLPILATANSIAIGKPNGYYTDWQISHTTGNSFISYCHYKRHYISHRTGKVLKTETMQHNMQITYFNPTCPKTIKSK